MEERKHPAFLILVVSVCAIAGIGLFPFLERNHRADFSRVETSPKTVHYRFKVWNTINQPISDAQLIVHAPLMQTGAQRCVRIEASHPYERAADSFGNPVLKFRFAPIAPYAFKVLSIRAHLMLAAAPVALSAADPDRFSGPVSGFDADDTDIRRLALQLKSGRVRITAKRLYRWVADNIVYNGYSREKKGARQVLASRQGDCTEFADLFVALARIVDLPARRVSGYLVHENRVLTPTDSHDWAEFYENGIWRIADPQQRNFDARYCDYIAMRIGDPSNAGGAIDGFHRFYVRGEGLKVKMDS
ncbi:MAG: transglutaminase domain-containing protein [Desulfosarcina sp.]